MKNIISALFLVLIFISTAEAAPVDRGDLYGSCIQDQNKKWKEGLGGTLKFLTPSQLEELDPYHLKAIQQQCNCTVTQVFKYLSQDTIQSYNTSLKNGTGDLSSGKDKASKEFQKFKMMDKQIACSEQALQSSGFEKKMEELSK